MPVIGTRDEDGYVVLLVRTKTGKEFETKVDRDVEAWASQFNWYQNAYGYVVAKDPNDPRPGPRLFLHRAVMDAEVGETVDHELGDTLDNRREKLRSATKKTNGQNRIRLSQANSSGLTGVRRSPNKKRWVANIKVDYRTLYLGTFDTKDEALAARLAAESKHFGEFASKTQER